MRARRSRSIGTKAILLAAALGYGADRADAVNKTWVGGNNTWASAAGWNPVNQPLVGDAVFLQQGVFTCTLDASATIPSLLSVSVSNNMTLLHTAGNFSMGTATVSLSNGTYNMSGGSMTFGAFQLGTGGAGAANFTGGTLTTGATSIGGVNTGAVTIGGASWRTSGSVTLGGPSAGTLQLNSGTLNGSSSTLTIGTNGVINMGGTGSMNFANIDMSAGTINYNSSLTQFTFTTLDQTGGQFNLGGSGTYSMNTGSYSLSGGTLLGTAMALSGSGRVEISGGVGSISNFTVGEAIGANSTLTLSGGAATFSIFNAGSAGLGTVNHLPGSGAFINSLRVGSNVSGTGRYSMSGGTLATGASTMLVGNGGAGTFTFTGGTISLGAGMQVGASSAGSFLMSGATSVFSAATGVDVGVTGLGQFNQSAGTVSVGGTLGVSRFAGNGTYLLSGGTLSAGTIEVQAGGFFDQFGTGAITSTTNINLNGGSIGNLTNNGTFIFNAGSIASNFTNGGTIIMNGFGTLNVGTFTNLSTGVFSIPNSRTLQVANSANLAGVGTIGPGGTMRVNGDLRIGFPNPATVSNSGFLDAIGGIIIGETSGNSGTLTMPGGFLATPFLTVGFIGSGTYIQSAGVANASFLTQVGSAAGTALFRLSGGAYTTQSVELFNGDLIVNGGTLSAVSITTFQNTSNLSLTSGAIDVGTLFLGNSVTFAPTGGTLRADVITFISSGSFSPGGSVNLDVDSINLNNGGRVEIPTSIFFDGTLNHIGGLLAGTFNNNGTYNYSSGVVGARIINNGALLLNGDMTTFEGLDNFSTIDINTPRTLTNSVLSTAPISNFGTINLSGGTIAGSPLGLNNFPGAVINARGTISAVFNNEGVLNTTGVLNVSGSLNNIGRIEVGAVESLRPSGTFTNSGQIILAGGSVAATTGTFSNSIGGLVRGNGNFSVANATANQGLLWADSGTPLNVTGIGTNGGAGIVRVGAGAVMTLVSPLNGNQGIVELLGADSILNAAGGIQNTTGTIRGRGVLSGNLQNTGVVRTDGGNLDLTGTSIDNNAGGIIEITSGTRLLVTQGIDTQAGIISLGGGTLDTGLNALANTGAISGRGAIRSGALTNTGTITLSGATSDIYPNLTQNGGRTIVTGFGTTTFYGNVVNTIGSELRVSTGATGIFLGDVNGLSLITGGGVKVFEGSAMGGPLVTPGRSIVTPGATLETVGIREVSLQVDGAANIDNTITSRLAQLTVGGSPDNWTGQFDLNNGRMILDYTGASPLATIANQIKSGRNGGAWDGTGISSSAAALQSNRAIGFVQVSDIGSPTTAFGESIDSTTILMRFTILGDTNLDAVVNITDFAFLAANFNTPSYWAKGDFNFDNVTNITDFALLASNFNQSIPGDLPRGGAVPEPSFSLLMLIFAAMNRQRRRDWAVIFPKS